MKEKIADSRNVWDLLDQVNTLKSWLLEWKLSPLGITPEKLDILEAIDVLGEGAIPARVSEKVARRNQSVAGALNRMEMDGLLRRDAKRKGKPVTNLLLLPKGREVLSKALAVRGKILHSLRLDTIYIDCGALAHLRDTLADEMDVQVIPLEDE